MTAPVFVTGGSGFIGKAVLRHLRHAGIAAVVPSRAMVDLLDSHAVARAIEEAEPACVLHLASPGPSSHAEDARLIEIEVAMARHLAAAIPAGVRLVFAGSVAEYGSPGHHREEDDCTPCNAYAEAKLQAGRAALDDCAARGVPAVVARIFGAYGPEEADYRLFPSLLRALAAHHPIDLSDGRQRRDFIHVGDVATTLVAMTTAPIPALPIVNVGTGHAVPVRDVVERLADEMGRSRDLLRFGAIRRSHHDQDMLEADTARLAAMLGQTPPQRLLTEQPILDLLHRDPPLIQAICTANGQD